MISFEDAHVYADAPHLALYPVEPLVYSLELLADFPKLLVYSLELLADSIKLLVYSLELRSGTPTRSRR